MDIITTQDLEQLARERTGSCVSLYLRTHTTGSEAQQDPISFSNLLPPAQQELVALGMKPQDARSLVRPARSLVSDTAFWKARSRGLAVFLANGFFRAYRLPLAVTDMLVVDSRFLLKPLLPLLCDGTGYYLLVLSQSKIRLFRGSRFGLEKVIVPGLPEGMKEAVSQEQNEAFPRNPVRASGTAGNGGRSDENISQYFPGVNEGLNRLLQNRNIPLVLAGVDYLLPLFRRANTYPDLLPGEIKGDQDALRAEALHEQAWPLVEPLFAGRRRDAVKEFQNCRGSAKTATAPADIVPAAYQGRVATLLLPARGKHEWGVVDRAHAGMVSRECRREEQGCEDLSDFAAVHTLLHGGKVHVVETDAIPREVSLAAVFQQ